MKHFMASSAPFLGSEQLRNHALTIMFDVKSVSPCKTYSGIRQNFAKRKFETSFFLINTLQLELQDTHPKFLLRLQPHGACKFEKSDTKIIKCVLIKYSQ